MNQPIDHTLKLQEALSKEFVGKEQGAVRSLLISILSYEHRAHKDNDFYFWARPYKKELKNRRLLVAHYYQQQGGKISAAILASELPPDKKWPGLVRLVETDGFDLI